MHKLLEAKLGHWRDRLISAYNESKDYPAPVQGIEREVFLHAFLTTILPPQFRIGAGVITDYKGDVSSQVDLVVELPLSLSFPVVGQNRMFMADTVGAAMEVKSTLEGTQWDDCWDKLRSIGRLSRKKLPGDGSILHLPEYTIPSFIVSYRGPKTLDTVLSHIHVKNTPLPAGIYVVESDLFVGWVDREVYEAVGAPNAMLAFIAALYRALQIRQSYTANLFDYAGIERGRRA